jgi:hypothetical protein
MDEEQRALPPKLRLAGGQLKRLCAGSGSTDGRCCAAAAGKKGGRRQ